MTKYDDIYAVAITDAVNRLTVLQEDTGLDMVEAIKRLKELVPPGTVEKMMTIVREP